MLGIDKEQFLGQLDLRSSGLVLVPYHHPDLDRVEPYPLVADARSLAHRTGAGSVFLVPTPGLVHGRLLRFFPLVVGPDRRHCRQNPLRALLGRCPTGLVACGLLHHRLRDRRMARHPTRRGTSSTSLGTRILVRPRIPLALYPRLLESPRRGHKPSPPKYHVPGCRTWNLRPSPNPRRKKLALRRRKTRRSSTKLPTHRPSPLGSEDPTPRWHAFIPCRFRPLQCHGRPHRTLPSRSLDHHP